jgi:hypothetical protein
MVENPNLPFGQMMQKVADNWRMLSPAEKEHFHKLAEQDKIRN